MIKIEKAKFYASRNGTRVLLNGAGHFLLASTFIAGNGEPDSAIVMFTPNAAGGLDSETLWSLGATSAEAVKEAERLATDRGIHLILQD